MAANIDEIEDVSDMYEMMTALGISSKGLKTVDEMKARVREEFNPSTLDKPNWTPGQVRIFFTVTHLQLNERVLVIMEFAC